MINLDVVILNNYKNSEHSYCVEIGEREKR